MTCVKTIVWMLVFIFQATVGSAAEMVSVPVPVQMLPKGHVLVDTDVELREMEASKVFAGTIQDASQLVGMQATWDLKAGEPINKLRLKATTDVNKSSLVNLVYRKGGVELMGSAQALEDGRIGQSIRVLNPDTRVTLVAVVTKQGEVEVR